MVLLRKFFEKAEEWFVTSALAAALGLGAVVITSLPFFADVWSWRDLIVALLGLIVLAGGLVGWRRKIPLVPSEGFARAASRLLDVRSSPRTALRIESANIDVRGDRIELRVDVSNVTAEDNIIVTDAVLRPRIRHLIVEESEVKRTVPPTLIPPGGTVSFCSYVLLHGPMAGVYQDRVRRWMGFVEIGISGRLMAKGPWGEEAQLVMDVPAIWILADPNVAHEAREAYRRGGNG